ncbi:uncharacterized protein BO66DRAFT_435852 [Aspergillus aculeatinus CBS 121060]|uniref:Uncharacterized protein n=1 Tax=Aspergillus aculeatinus CBS 121060 TaxID=1448322 RepID=A0ACD1HHR8_9EURO|nr:hypothetical protein BO66DRAFT_435852 [Aspergillus aculeatinus CBS 121060]RAH72957.1 hypothetical protein BO66DRAFT_435852 [Aspergillus aculeatinus CBS 121060]
MSILGSTPSTFKATLEPPQNTADVSKTGTKPDPPKDDESASLSGNGAANRHLDDTLDWLIRYTSRRRKKELSILPTMATRYAEEKGTWDKASRQEKGISEEVLQRSRPAYYHKLSGHETRLPADIQIGPVIHYDKSEKTEDVFLDRLSLKPKLLDTEDEWKSQIMSPLWYTKEDDTVFVYDKADLSLQTSNPSNQIRI